MKSGWKVNECLKARVRSENASCAVLEEAGGGYGCQRSNIGHGEKSPRTRREMIVKQFITVKDCHRVACPSKSIVRRL